MSSEELEKTIAELIAPAKGILAADESAGTIEKRFKSINVASTEESRRNYREMLFTTPGLGEFISGVILYEETLQQKTKGGTPPFTTQYFNASTRPYYLELPVNVVLGVPLKGIPLANPFIFYSIVQHNFAVAVLQWR